ncbi:MAG: Hsp20/alpha crystallin family protein [Tepidisphaeraceae bacterium]
MPVSTATEPPAFGQIARQMTKIMEQAQKGYFAFSPNETWTPNVNMYETDDGYHVCVDLCGVEKEKIDLVVHDQRLTLRGQRHVPSCEEIEGDNDRVPRRVRVHVMEIDHGAFCRDVELPHDVAADRIVAKYDNGVLWIHLPKK